MICLGLSVPHDVVQIVVFCAEQFDEVRIDFLQYRLAQLFFGPLDAFRTVFGVPVRDEV